MYLVSEMPEDVVAGTVVFLMQTPPFHKGTVAAPVMALPDMKY